MSEEKEHENLYDFDDFDLNEYVRYRPTYPPELYNIIYDYHKRAGGQWQVAHDAGAGPGVVAEELVQHFDKVYVSDASEQYITIAQRRAARNLSKDNQSRIEFHTNPAEEMSFLEDNSVDVVTIATAFHWMLADKVVAAAQRVLKPGGTFAVLTYGAIPFSDDPEISKSLVKIYHVYVEERAAPATNKNGEKSAGWWSASVLLDSGPDGIELPEDQWEPGAVRIWWNSKFPLCGWPPNSKMTSPAGDGKSTYQPKLKPQDKPTEHIDDPDFITRVEDVEWINGYTDSLVPNLPMTQSYLDAVEDLSKNVGGRNVKITYRWPAMVLLATKR